MSTNKKETKPGYTLMATVLEKTIAELEARKAPKAQIQAAKEELARVRSGEL